MASPNDPPSHLTFGQLARWLAYGSPSEDALGTIGGWLQDRFSAWKVGHSIQPVKARSKGDPAPSKIGVSGLITDLGWSVDEFSKTFDFKPKRVRLWKARRKSPKDRDYFMLLGIRRARDALVNGPNPLLSAGDEIGRKAEEGGLKVFGLPVDQGARLQVIPPIDFNRGKFSFDPIEDEADLVVMDEVPGGKQKAAIWRGLRFERESVLASFPKLIGTAPSPARDIPSPKFLQRVVDDQNETLSEVTPEGTPSLAMPSDVVSDTERDDWIRAYYAQHQADKKKPLVPEIETAANRHFARRRILKLRPAIRELRPSGWASRGPRAAK